ncbi:MAG: DUF4412 domain-containing protein [Thermodesulfobacteria bacterium]|nr:DUF4412 domain-containing protein [Thermodesulfobacteriota bacterium]
MKKFLLLVALSLSVVLGASPLLAGILIEAQTSDGDRLTWACEDGLFRIGMGEAYTIMDTNNEMTYVVIPKEKIYYASSVEENQQRMKAMQEQMKKMQKALGAMGKKFGKIFGEKQEIQPPKEKPSKFTHKKTGKKSRIAGYTAEQLIIYENGRPVSEVWVSEKLARDLRKSCNVEKLTKMTEATLPEEWQTSKRKMSALEMKDFEEFGYPLKEVSYEDNYRVEVIKVEKKPLPKSLFSVPKGYKKASYPSLQGGFQSW